MAWCCSRTRARMGGLSASCRRIRPSPPLRRQTNGIGSSRKRLRGRGAAFFIEVCQASPSAGRCCFVILSEAKNLSSISVQAINQEGFFASLRMTTFNIFRLTVQSVDFHLILANLRSLRFRMEPHRLKPVPLGSLHHWCKSSCAVVFFEGR